MTVSFHLSPEQEQLKLGARQFAEEHLRPLAAEVAKEPDPLRRALLARPAFEKAVAASSRTCSAHPDTTRSAPPE
jgi:nitroalkane oxidase